MVTHPVQGEKLSKCKVLLHHAGICWVMFLINYNFITNAVYKDFVRISDDFLEVCTYFKLYFKICIKFSRITTDYILNVFCIKVPTVYHKNEANNMHYIKYWGRNKWENNNCACFKGKYETNLLEYVLKFSIIISWWSNMRRGAKSLNLLWKIVIVCDYYTNEWAKFWSSAPPWPS